MCQVMCMFWFEVVCSRLSPKSPDTVGRTKSRFTDSKIIISAPFSNKNKPLMITRTLRVIIRGLFGMRGNTVFI